MTNVYPLDGQHNDQGAAPQQGGAESMKFGLIEGVMGTAATRLHSVSVVRRARWQT